MKYCKKAALKVECIASKEDFDFFGITLEDVLDRTEAGTYFLKKGKRALRHDAEGQMDEYSIHAQYHDAS